MHFEWKVVKQNKKTELEHYTFWNCYIQGAPQKKQYHCFFCGAGKNLKNKWLLYVHFG